MLNIMTRSDLASLETRLVNVLIFLGKKRDLAGIALKKCVSHRILVEKEQECGNRR